MDLEKRGRAEMVIPMQKSSREIHKLNKHILAERKPFPQTEPDKDPKSTSGDAGEKR